MHANRWLKEFQISLASERSQRQLAREIIGDNLQAEKAPFSFTKDGGGEEIREIPFVFVPNLIRKVADVVAHNERYAQVKNSHTQRLYM